MSNASKTGACSGEPVPCCHEHANGRPHYVLCQAQRASDSCPSRSSTGGRCASRAGHFGNVHGDPKRQEEWVEDLPEQRSSDPVPSVETLREFNRLINEHNAQRPEPAVPDERRIEERLVVTDLCDMHAFHRDGRLGEVLRRAINFIEGRECFPGYPATKRCACGECRESPSLRDELSVADDALTELWNGIRKAARKHPGGPDGMRSLVEEVGEVASAMRRETPERVRAELIDVAVVAIRWWVQLGAAQVRSTDGGTK